MDIKPQANQLYNKGKDAADKFDYFVCTVAGAIFAYIAQHYTPKILAIDAASLEPVSLLLLAGSFFCGLKRIELGYRIIHLDREFSILVQSPSMDAAERLKPVISKSRARSKCFYILRDRLLLAGFVTIFAAKVLQPYGADSSAHTTIAAPSADIQSPAAHPVASPIPKISPVAPNTTNKTSK